MISKILEKGKIIEISGIEGVGSTREAHIALVNKKKYLLRICKDKETANRYLKYYHMFKKCCFFPKLLEHKDRYLLFEFIKGRAGRRLESEKIIFQIGRICALINNTKADYEYEAGFLKKLKLIEQKKILSGNIIKEVEKSFNNLNKKVKLQTSLDAGDVTDDNFIVYKKKVYFVDIEAVKPNIKGYGIAKAFSSWFISDKEKEAFREGYNSISSMNFFNDDYSNLVTLIFLIHRIYFKFNKRELGIVKKSVDKLNRLLEEVKK